VSCEETQALAHAYADGELDAARSLEVERHAGSCAACAEAVRSVRELRSAIRGAELYALAPAGVERRVRRALRQASGAGKRRGSAPWAALWRQPGLAVAFALAAALSWTVGRLSVRPAAGDAAAQQVVSSHIRSLMPGHLTDVLSSDQHTVKPWFSGKVDFSPAVKDLSAQGFSLAGGRLDYVDGRPAAALVYRRRQHVINLFVWPEAGRPDSGPRALAAQGYNLVQWTRSGMAYWAASDLNAAELQELARLVP
jgi:anti-sigma factor RsiW